MEYGYRVELSVPYETAVEQVTAALKEQGFGVLTSIDVKATLKARLGVESGKYVILGACNPPLAHRALQTDPEVGLLLPCNVIVYENEESGSTVSVVSPMSMVTLTGNPGLGVVADEADARLRRVVAALAE
jgi:uncharacterized protein (DUF302 family)